MKGISPVISIVLLLLLTLAATGGYVLYFNQASNTATTSSEKNIVYPQNPPVVQSIHCYPGYGWFDVMDSGTEGIEGTVIYSISGEISKTDTQDVNISTYGKIYFGIPGQVGDTINVKVYTPYWEFSERCTVQQDSYLKLYLPMDEGAGITTADATSNGNDGTLIGNNSGTVYGGADGTVSGALWKTGHSQGGLYFDGTDDVVNLDDDLFNFSNYDAFTICTWVKRTTSGAGGFIGYPGSSSIERSPSMYYYPDETSLHFGFGDGTIWHGYTAPSVLILNAWQFTCIRWDYSTGFIEAFVNGTEVYSHDMGATRPFSNTKYNFGRVDSFHNGFMDNVYIYNRALNDSEMTRLYQGTDVSLGLVGYWNFNEGYGTTVEDSHFLVSGQYGNAMNFDGDDDYVEVPYSPDIDLNDTGTISFFYKSNGWLDVYNSIMQRGDNGGWCENSFSPFHIFNHYATGSGKIFFSMCNDTTASSVEISPRPSENVWHHYVFTWNGTLMTSYVDSVLNDTSPQYNNMRQGDYDLWFGKSSAGTVNGILDDVRIYDRAINSTEVTQLYQGTDVRDDLVSYWDFDESSGTTVDDSHLWTTGKSGTAINFDGVDDYITVENSAVHNITGPFTISTFVKFSENSGGATTLLIKGSLNPRYDNYLLYMDPTSDYLRFFIGMCNATYPPYATVISPIEEERWYHIAAVYNGTHSLTYVDGEFVDSTEIYYTPCKSTEPILLGYKWTSYFSGMLDEFRLYNKALSQGEINALYTAYD